MQDSYESVELDETQTEWVCRGLLDLAAVDGVHPAELEMIKDFYVQGGGQAAGLDALRSKGFDAKAAAEALTGSARDTFFISCYMLILADGEVSEPETARMKQYAEAFGVGEDALAGYDVKARQTFLGMMADELRNKDAVRQVGAELGLTDAQIDQAMEG